MKKIGARHLISMCCFTGNYGLENFRGEGYSKDHRLVKATNNRVRHTLKKMMEDELNEEYYN